MSKKTKSAQTKPTAKVIPLTEYLVHYQFDENRGISGVEFTPEAYVKYVGSYLSVLRNKKAVVDVRNELELRTYAKGWAKLDLGNHWKFDCALTIRNAMNVYFSLPCDSDRALLIPLLDELQDRYSRNVAFDQEVAA